MDLTLGHLKDRIAVVTGASAGIGKAIVEALVSRGFRVVGLARRVEKLVELARQLENESGTFFPLQADVTKEDDLVKAFQWIKANVRSVYVVVNNAGIMRQSRLVDGDTNSWKEIIDTNVLGLCIATREAVQDMKENNVNGHIIHINSICGHVVPNSPSLHIYTASKRAVTALTETLRQKLNSVGSKIRSICPGQVRSEMATASGIIFNEEQKQSFENSPFLEPEDIANSVVFVLSTPPHVQVHELIIKPIGEAVLSI